MAEALRVGLVIDDSLDRPDGVQQYVLTLGGWLESQGHQVHYLTASTTRTDLTHLHNLGRTVGVKFNGNTLGTPLPVSRRVARRLLGELSLDVVHVQMPYSPLLAGRVIDAAAAQGTPVVGTFHIYPESWLVTTGARVLGWTQRRRLRKFLTVLAVSEAAESCAARAFKLNPQVVGNPVDTARFAAAADAAAAARTELVESVASVSSLRSSATAFVSETTRERVSRSTRLSSEPVETTDTTKTARIVFLGRLVSRKGPRQLLEALGRIAIQNPERPWRAVIAGRGPLLDDLTALAVKLEIADRVEFPGFVDEADKAALLAGADVVALPSTGGESFGISVVEALAASTGVVLAGDNPGYRTVMRGLESQLIPPDDTSRFAAAIIDALDAVADPVQRKAITQAQRQAAQRFDIHCIGAQVTEVYRTAVSSCALRLRAG